MPAPLPPMLGLTTSGKVKASGSLGCLVGVMDDPRSGIAQTELLQDVKLHRLGRAYQVGVVAVDDLGPDAFQVGQVLLDVQDDLGVAATRGVGADAIHERVNRGNVEAQGRSDAPLMKSFYIRNPSPLQLGKERLEPLWMLVENGDRPVGHFATQTCP